MNFDVIITEVVICVPENDFDGDGVCDNADPCPFDNPNDSDADGSCDSDDICPGEDDFLDTDFDEIVDCLDSCPNDFDKIANILDDITIYYRDIGNILASRTVCLHALRLRKWYLPEKHPDIEKNIDDLIIIHSSLQDNKAARCLFEYKMERGNYFSFLKSKEKKQ